MVPKLGQQQQLDHGESVINILLDNTGKKWCGVNDFSGGLSLNFSGKSD